MSRCPRCGCPRCGTVRCPCCGAAGELGHFGVCATCAAGLGWFPPCAACQAEQRGETVGDLRHVETCASAPKERA